MKRTYKGKIDKLNKIVISDPSYDKEVDCRYEKDFNKENLDVQVNINETDEIIYYEKEKYHVRGIELAILIKNSECKDVNMSINNNVNYNHKDYNKVNNYQIAMDSSCVALGINKNAKKIIDSKDNWQPKCALKTTTDGIFGEVNEVLKNGETKFISIYGFLDEDAGYSTEEIKKYITENFEINNLTLENEIDENKDLHRVIYKEPGKEAKIINVGKDLKSQQEIVGGLIETVPFTENTILVCNEEGKLDGLLPNIRYGKFDAIVGNFFIIGDDEENCDFRSLTEEEIDECMEKIDELSFEINEEQESI